MEGTLMKRSNTLHQWRSRWFVLPRGSSTLLYRAAVDDDKLRGTISLIHASVTIFEPPSTRPDWFCFLIQSPRGSYALATDSEAQRAKWMTLIDLAAAGSSMQATAWAAAAAAAACNVDGHRFQGRSQGLRHIGDSSWGAAYIDSRPLSTRHLSAEGSSGFSLPIPGSKPDASLKLGSEVMDVRAVSIAVERSQKEAGALAHWLTREPEASDRPVWGIGSNAQKNTSLTSGGQSFAADLPAENIQGSNRRRLLSVSQIHGSSGSFETSGAATDDNASDGTDSGNAGLHQAEDFSSRAQDKATIRSGKARYDVSGEGNETVGSFDGSFAEVSCSDDGLDKEGGPAEAFSRMAEPGKQYDGQPTSATEGGHDGYMVEKKGRGRPFLEAQATLMAAWTSFKEHPRTQSLTSLVTGFGSTEASDSASCKSASATDLSDPVLLEGSADHQERQCTAEQGAGAAEQFANLDIWEQQAEDYEDWSLAEEAALEAPAGAGIQRTYFRAVPCSEREGAPQEGMPGEPLHVEGDSESGTSPSLTWLEGGAAAIVNQHAGHKDEPSEVWASEPRRGWLLAQAKQWVNWETNKPGESGMLQQLQLKYENLAISLERAAEALRSQERRVSELQRHVAGERQRVERVMMHAADVGAKARAQAAKELAAANEVNAKEVAVNWQLFAENAQLRAQLQQAQESISMLQLLLQKKEAENAQSQTTSKQVEGAAATSPSDAEQLEEALNSWRPGYSSVEVALMKPFWAP